MKLSVVIGESFISTVYSNKDCGYTHVYSYW